jgi:hypothetical protein
MRLRASLTLRFLPLFVFAVVAFLVVEPLMTSLEVTLQGTPPPASALAPISPRPRASFKLKQSLETLATTAFSRHTSRSAMVD